VRERVNKLALAIFTDEEFERPVGNKMKDYIITAKKIIHNVEYVHHLKPGSEFLLQTVYGPEPYRILCKYTRETNTWGVLEARCCINLC
jgi:hypothetical protein